MVTDIALSVCYIVKNEQENIEHSIQSIIGAADEVVVVDTGSDDRTPEIAERAGAKVVRSSWCDDFSYSRNISIDNASGRWILWLDGDDYVPSASAGKIQELKKEKPECVFGMVVKNERPNGTGTEFIQARMFPNRPDIRFQRRIHEQVLPSAVRAGMKMVETDAVIEHHGYIDPETMKRKAERNSELIEIEYSESGPDPYLAVEAGDAFWITQDYDRAFKWYRETLEAGSKTKGAAEPESQALYGMGRIEIKKGNPEEALKYYNASLDRISKRPDVMYMSALACEDTGRRDEAVKILREIIDLPVKVWKVGVDFRSVKIKSYLKLFELLREDSLTEEMNSLCDKALKRFPGRVEIFNMCGRCKLYTGKLIDALHMFERSINTDSAHNIDAFIGLCIIYSRAGKRDAVKASMKTMERLFSNAPRYRAFKTLMLGLESEGDEEIEREISYLHRVFGESCFPAN